MKPRGWKGDWSQAKQRGPPIIYLLKKRVADPSPAPYWPGISFFQIPFNCNSNNFWGLKILKLSCHSNFSVPDNFSTLFIFLLDPGYGIKKQCCGSGSTGSTCFWASWIRIRILLWIRIRILLSSSKNSKKNLESYYFVTPFDFLSLKNNVNVASKSNKQTKLC